MSVFVSSVTVDFVSAKFSLFVLNQVCIVLRYGFTCSTAVVMLVCVDVIV